MRRAELFLAVEELARIRLLRCGTVGNRCTAQEYRQALAKEQSASVHAGLGVPHGDLQRVRHFPHRETFHIAQNDRDSVLGREVFDRRVQCDAQLRLAAGSSIRADQSLIGPACRPSS